jgi:LPS export ABC transporter protein LptC
LLSITACKENDITKVKSMFDEQSAQIETADSVTFTYKEGAYKRAIITGNTIQRYTKSQNKIVFPNGLLVKFYQELNLISVLKANYAENDDTKQLIQISGNVYMENHKNEILETDSLTWNMQTKKVYTNQSIKIKTPDNIIKGIGFIADEDFSNYTIRKVTGIVSVDNDNGFQ